MITLLIINCFLPSSPLPRPDLGDADLTKDDELDRTTATMDECRAPPFQVNHPGFYRSFCCEVSLQYSGGSVVTTYDGQFAGLSSRIGTFAKF